MDYHGNPCYFTLACSAVREWLHVLDGCGTLGGGGVIISYIATLNNLSFCYGIVK
jgi:hypothetical protein